MRRLFIMTIASALFLGALLSFGSISAHADDLTPEQTDRIKTACVAIKSSLNQLHAADALLRVNRGQVYESMASKLMDTFNARLSNNSLDNKAMVTATANYRTALTTFRTDYIAYEQRMSETLRIDCVSQPNTFHASLLLARELREIVHQDVEKLHNYINDYRSSVNSFLVNYERVSQ